METALPRRVDRRVGDVHSTVECAPCGTMRTRLEATLG